MGKKNKVYPGLKINRWTIIKEVRKSGKRNGWLCKCDCGKIKHIKNIGTIFNGSSSSCGCYKNEYYKNNNPMHNPEICKRMSEIMKSKPEQMENIKKAVIAAQSKEAKLKRIATNMKKYGGKSPSCNKQIRDKQKQTCLVKYGYESASKNEEIIKKIKKTNLKKYGFGCVLQNEEVKKKICKTNNNKYGASSILSLKEFRKKSLQTLKKRYGIKEEIVNVMQIPQIRKKAFKNKGMTKPEKKFYEMLKNNNISFEYEALCGESNKLWDFVIYNQNKTPIIVVEIDGEYVHGLNSDPNGIKCGGIDDHTRFLKIPDGVKYIQCDSLKIDECFKETLRLFNIDYDKYIEEMVNRCIGEPFPYPKEEDKKMKKAYRELIKYDKIPNKGALLGNSIIYNFHKSIWKCRKLGKKSPLEAWNNKKMLEKCIKNRIIYKGIEGLSSMQILRGFTISQSAPRVSIFMPPMAKYLLSKYAPQSKTAVDPFSGFSGRMLGAASLGMSYTGYDIREETIEESKKIVEYLALPNINLYKNSIEESKDENEYDVLITCPPYGNIEIWENNQNCKEEDYYIDLCLNKFKCKKFIFIVKNTNKYKNKVVEVLKSSSHVSKGEELVLLFKKNKKTIAL